MATVVKVTRKDGLAYAVDDGGAKDMKVVYQVQLSAPLDVDELPEALSDGSVEVPPVGTAHPARSDYAVDKWEVSQPKGAAKNTLDVTVTYAPAANESEEDSEETEGEIESRVEDWGWDDSTSDREMVTDSAGAPVVNSAGDFFDSVPSVQTPAPVFTKVVKMSIRRTFASYNCKVNASQITIGNITCAPHTLLCSVSEKRNFGNTKYPYTYTVKLKYRLNMAKVEGAQAATECGWDVVIADAGMRELDDDTGQLKLIQVISQETGQASNVSSPELLDGAGHAVTRSASGDPPTPYNLVFAAYSPADFPEWFYSEPPLPEEEEENANANA